MSPRNRNVLAPHLDEIKRLRLAGWSMQRIADRFGVHHGSVCKRLRQMGLHPARTNRGALKGKVAKLQALRIEGWSLNQLAVYFGVTTSPIRRLLQAPGTARRPPAKNSGKLAPHLQELRNLRAHGWTHQELADRFGVTPKAIAWRLNRLRGITGRLAELESLRINGWSITALAAKYRVAHSTVHYHLRRLAAEAEESE